MADTTAAATDGQPGAQAAQPGGGHDAGQQPYKLDMAHQEVERLIAELDDIVQSVPEGGWLAIEPVANMVRGRSLVVAAVVPAHRRLFYMLEATRYLNGHTWPFTRTGSQHLSVGPLALPPTPTRVLGCPPGVPLCIMPQKKSPCSCARTSATRTRPSLRTHCTGVSSSSCLRFRTRRSRWVELQRHLGTVTRAPARGRTVQRRHGAPRRKGSRDRQG